MLLSLCCSVVIMLYCYCVALLLFVLSYVLIVCTVPLPPGVNPIAVDKYINDLFVFGATAPQWARASSFTRFLYHTQRRTTVGRTPLDE